MEPNEDESGGLKKKVATGVAVGLATAAAAGAAKKLLGNEDESEQSGDDQAQGGQGSQPGRTRSASGTREHASTANVAVEPARRSGSSDRQAGHARRSHVALEQREAEVVAVVLVPVAGEGLVELGRIEHAEAPGADEGTALQPGASG